ncbi:MAG: hypothetical protein ACNS60_04900 [Candidatus Cyclobacteriaceae bacterium M2_1C_046]
MNFKKYIPLFIFIGAIAFTSCEPSPKEGEPLEEEEHLENIEHTPEQDSIADRKM